MTIPNHIILASQSPRRREILEKHGIQPIIMPTETDETLPDGIGMRDAVMYLALQKGLACLKQLNLQDNSEESYIISADTVVYKDEILGKPVDREDAIRMLEKIKGTWHEVATGVAILNTKTMEKQVFCDVTKVYCKDYTRENLEEYIDTEKPYDKAGAYAIQEGFGKYVDHLEGDIETVIGLPFERIKIALENF